MKKPEIKVNEFWIDDDEVNMGGGSISINDKELFEDETADIIEEMIDALMLARGALIGAGFTHEGLVLNDIDKALKKAGCEL